MSVRSKMLQSVLFFIVSVIPLCCSISLAAKETLTLGLMGEPEEGFDPVLGWGRYGNPLFQSTLLKRNNSLDIENDLALSYNVSSDGKTWEILIRDGVLFSDGKPLTAEDVAFTFEQASKSGGKADLSMLDHAEVLSANTVRFHLKRRDSTFINRLISLGIVPKGVYGKGYSRKPVGSGPFVLLSWSEGEQMIALRNPTYYGEKPSFSKIVFLYGNEDTIFAAAKAGKLDMAVVPPHLANQKIRGMRLHRVKSVDNRGLMFPCVPNMGKKSITGAPIGNDVTSDLSIRKAINIAIDRSVLVRGVLSGYGRPAYFVCDSLPWDNEQNKLNDGNRSFAEKILTDGGWLDRDNDGIREKNGIRASFTIIYPSDRSIRQGLSLAVSDMLKTIGIETRVEGKSWDGIKQQMHSDVIVFGWGSHDPMELYHLHHSRLSGEGYYNAGFYRNETVDRYLDQAVNAGRYEDSLSFWKKAQFDGKTGCGPKGDVPWVWLVNLDHVYLVNEHLWIGESRIEPHGHGWPITANITQWRWKNEQQEPGEGDI